MPVCRDCQNELDPAVNWSPGPVKAQSHICKGCVSARGSKWYLASKGGVPTPRAKKQTPEHIAARSASVAASLSATAAVCVECGGDFIRTQAAQKYCSGMCWNKKAARKRERTHRIQVSPTAYAELADKYGTACGICATPAGGNSRGGRLAVDHCHDTGAIRGLLCHRCNTALGLLKDDTETILRAALYLEQSRHAGHKEGF